MRRSSMAPRAQNRSWLRSLRAAFGRDRSRPTRKRRRRGLAGAEAAQVDLLEDRCLLSPLGALRAGGGEFGRRDFDDDGGRVTVEVKGGDLIVRGSRAADAVNISFNPGTNQIIFTGANGTTINDRAEPFVIAASGIDDLRINTRGSDDRVILQGLFVPGDLEIDGGDGSDEIVLTGVTIGEDLEIDTNSGHDTVALQTVTVSGETEIETDDGHDDVIIDASSFGGDVNISTDDGHDTLLINASTFSDEVEIETDDGHDVIVIEGSTFREDVTIETGDGHDRVAILASTFSEELDVDLGDGHDQLVLNLNSFDDAEADGGDGRDELLTSNGDVDDEDFERFGSANQAAFFDELETRAANRLGIPRDQLDFDELDDLIDLVFDDLLDTGV